MNCHHGLMRIMRTVIALSLVLWCAGAGCMLVSYAHGVAMNAEEMSAHHSMMPSVSDSSHMNHDCCKARHSSSNRVAGSTETRSAFPDEQLALPINPTPSDAMSCCPLTSGSFVLASRTRTNDTNDSRLIKSDELHLSLTEFKAAPLDPPLRLPTQNQTYLRCCVFLI